MFLRLSFSALGLLAALGGALVSARVPQQQPTALQAGDIVITGGQLFDSVSDTLRPNTGLVIRRGIFLEVGAALGGRDTGTATVIRLSDGETVLPGLFDLHAHYAVDLFGQGRVDEYTANPVIFLANGVTSTFPAGEVDPEGMLAARRRIDRGEQPGPRILTSGPYYGTARPGWQNAAVTADQIRKDVDEWASRGARGFKAKGIRPAHLEVPHRAGPPSRAAGDRAPRLRCPQLGEPT